MSHEIILLKSTTFRQLTVKEESDLASAQHDQYLLYKTTLDEQLHPCNTPTI